MPEHSELRLHLLRWVRDLPEDALHHVQRLVDAAGDLGMGTVHEGQKGAHAAKQDVEEII